jgi:hypothetical protein
MRAALLEDPEGSRFGTQFDAYEQQNFRAGTESLAVGHVLNGGVDVEACETILNRICSVFSERCVNCVFCRMCSGCPASYADASGGISTESIDAHCARMAAECSDTLLEYVGALHRNPHCLNYLDEMVPI